MRLKRTVENITVKVRGLVAADEQLLRQFSSLKEKVGKTNNKWAHIWKNECLSDRAKKGKWRRSRTGGRHVSMQRNLCNGVKLLKNFEFLSLLHRHC